MRQGGAYEVPKQGEEPVLKQRTENRRAGEPMPAADTTAKPTAKPTAQSTADSKPAAKRGKSK